VRGRLAKWRGKRIERGERRVISLIEIVKRDSSKEPEKGGELDGKREKELKETGEL